MPLRLEAAILSRTRSPITSRSNWAKDSSTLSVSRPMLEVVLNDWVTDTKETACWSNSSTSLAKSASDRVSRSTLYHNDVDPAEPDSASSPAGQDGRGGPREGAVVVAVRDQPPALVGLALDIGLAGLALGIERVEFQVEVMLGRLAGVDRAALGFGEHSFPRARHSPSPRGNQAEPIGGYRSRAGVLEWPAS